MSKEQKSGSSSLASSIKIAYLVRAHGVTRDQARRLINRIGNNRAKLSEAARILKARLPSRSVSPVTSACGTNVMVALAANDLMTRHLCSRRPLLRGAATNRGTVHQAP